MDENESMLPPDCGRGIPWRVAHGMGGVREARQIEGLMERLARYERALRDIAAHGDGDSAARARRALGTDE